MAGGERSLAEIVSAIAKQNDTKIGVVLPGKGQLETLLPEKVSLFYCEQFWWIKKWYPEKYSKRDLFWILRYCISSARKIIKDFSPDVIITNTSVICSFAIAAKIEKKHHCWHIRELVEKNLQANFMLGNWLSMKIISALSDYVYVNSDFLLKECSRYIKKDIYKVRQQVFCKQESLDRSCLGKPKISIIGAVSPHKAQDEAVKAFKILKKNGTEMELFIVGWHNEKNDYYQKLRELAVDTNVHFIQFLEDVNSIYSETDIVLVCSCESFGRVAIEAMKHSIPVVAANVGGSVELIKNGYNGYLYEKNNPEDLANKIMLLQNPDIRNEMGHNGYMFATGNYNEENMINDFMQPLSKIFGTH
ncbi:MAG: glycosyltransferase [Salinivirgaceae bacterium]|nr:glycosyltransferase [Salinivirgaceae bacterium]